MMYGHLDKQPPCEGWFEEEGIFPYKPFIKDDKVNKSFFLFLFSNYSKY